jgi:AraC-like DNA-binding protein
MILPDFALDPLHRFPVFRTSDPEELRHLGSTLFGAARIDLDNTDNFEARVNLIQLQEIGLAFGATTSDLAIDHLETDFIRFQIALKGRASTSANGMITEINDRQLAITPSGVSSRTVCEAGHQRLTLRLNDRALSQRLTVLLGAKPKGEMKFEPAIDVDRPETQFLCQLVHFLSQQLDSNAFKLPAAVCLELEHALQTGFLWATRHAFSHVLQSQESALAPRMVKRLEEFIEANWQDALTIERLAGEAGTSARAIFRAFERSRGYSPMAFAKMVRLRRAREIFMSGDPGVSVTATAFICNFGSVGHFARNYRDAFGELPSQTISAARR